MNSEMLAELFWLWSDRITIVLALIAAIFSLFTWWSLRVAEKKRRQEICILFRCLDAAGSDEVALPYKPRRDQLSRGELTGIVSFYVGGGLQRYNTSGLRTILQDGTLDRVLLGDLWSGQDEELEIPVDRELFEALRRSIEQTETAPAMDDCQASDERLHLKLSADGGLLEVQLTDKADSGQLVASAERLLNKMAFPGGKLIRINGAHPLPVAMAIAHKLAHRYAAVAIFDPKVSGFVVAISHEPQIAVGDVIE